MSIETQWQTTYDEYQNPEWFQDIYYVESMHQDPYSKYRGVLGPARLKSDFGQFFTAFDKRDWETLENTADIERKHLNEDLDLMVSQRDENRAREVKMLERKRDLEIDKAEGKLERDTAKSDLGKESLRLSALKNISELDDMIAKTGLTSGSYDKKKEISLDHVVTALHQANFSDMVGNRNLKKTKSRATRQLDDALAVSDARYDAQYNVNLQTNENKKEVIDLDLMLDKMSVYEDWRVGNIRTLSRLAGEGAFLFDMTGGSNERDEYIRHRLEEFALEELDEDGNYKYLLEDGETVAVGQYVDDLIEGRIVTYYEDRYVNTDIIMDGDVEATCSNFRAGHTATEYGTNEALTDQVCGEAYSVYETDMTNTEGLHSSEFCSDYHYDRDDFDDPRGSCQEAYDNILSDIGQNFWRDHSGGGIVEHKDWEIDLSDEETRADDWMTIEDYRHYLSQDILAGRQNPHYDAYADMPSTAGEHGAKIVNILQEDAFLYGCLDPKSYNYNAGAYLHDQSLCQDRWQDYIDPMAPDTYDPYRTFIFRDAYSGR